MSNWARRLSRFGGLTGILLMSGLAQDQQPAGAMPAGLIVFVIAIAGAVIIGVGIAAVLWLLSLGAPHAAVGAAPAKPVRPREVLPEGVHLPAPSIQPLILAAGLTIIAFGLVFRSFAIQLGENFSIPIIPVLGLLIVAAGFIGWIRESHHAADEH